MSTHSTELTESLSAVSKYLTDYYHCKIDDINELINTITGWCANTKQRLPWLHIHDYYDSYMGWGLHMSPQESKACKAKFEYHWSCSDCIDAVEELDEHLHFMGFDEDLVLGVFMMMCANCFAMRNVN